MPKPMSSQVLGRSEELLKVSMLHMGHYKQQHFHVSMFFVGVNSGHFSRKRNYSLALAAL